MKYTIIAAFSLLSTLVSGLALPDLASRQANVFYPEITILVKEDFPNQPFPPTNIGEVSRSNGAHTVISLIGFNLPASAGKSCTISFSNALTATGSRRIQLFTMIGYPAFGITYNSRPPTNVHVGTFIVDASAPPGTVEEGFGLTFSCPTVPTKYGFVAMPVGENVSVTWDTTSGGFIITSN